MMAQRQYCVHTPSDTPFLTCVDYQIKQTKMTISKFLNHKHNDLFYLCTSPIFQTSFFFFKARCFQAWWLKPVRLQAEGVESGRQTPAPQPYTPSSKASQRFLFGVMEIGKGVEVYAVENIFQSSPPDPLKGRF